MFIPIESTEIAPLILTGVPSNSNARDGLHNPTRHLPLLLGGLI
jgi:hypothetical protein